MEEESKTSSCPIISSSLMASVEDVDEEVKELIPSLPKDYGWLDTLCLYQGFWCPVKRVPNVMFSQRHNQVQDKDIVVASTPKSGTTWLKALTFTIVNRSHYTFSNSPLLTSNPHDLIPSIEVSDFRTIPSQRLLSTHLPYSALAESFKHSRCKIVYICRNPFDTAVSLWHFVCDLRPESKVPWSMEEFFCKYFNGISPFGPFWDHVLGYWKACLEEPNKVLFLKYEDLKEDIVNNLKRLAEFIGYPFSQEEETQGVVEEIAKLCSLSNLKDLEVNKHGEYLPKFPKKALFRKGEVGNWRNYLSPSKEENLKNVMQEKLSGSGLSFKL